MTLAETHPPIAATSQENQENAWVNATWEEFFAIADDPASEKKTCYYYDRQMRIETMGVRPDHAIDNTIVTLAIGLFCMVKGIPVRGLINASYRKPGCKEAQPDASYYVGEKARSVPQGNTIVNLDLYPAPDLAIEVAATSLNDDIGVKRLLYEELGVREYWVVDVKMLAFLLFKLSIGAVNASTLLMYFRDWK